MCDDDRTKIIERITNLRAKASSTNSENEAMAAFSLADRLMESYRVNEAELALAEADGTVTFEITEEPINTSWLWNGNRRSVGMRVLWTLQDLTETKCVIWSSGYKALATGDRMDIEWLNYLLEVVVTTCRREYEAFKKTQQGVPRSAKGAFEAAFAYRVSDRVREMIREREKDRREMRETERALLESREQDLDEILSTMAATGKIDPINASRELVIVSAVAAKREAVDAAFTKAHPRLGTASGFGHTHNRTASAAGAAAGGRVNLTKGIGSSSRAQLN